MYGTSGRKSLSLFSLSSETETYFCSLIYKWYQKMATIIWHKHKTMHCFNCFENLWIKSYSEMPNWNQPGQDSQGRKNKKEIRTTTRKRPAVTDRNLFPRFKAERVLWMAQGVIIVLTLGSVFNGYSHRLASVKCIWLPGSSERKMKERLASMEELMCPTHQRYSNGKDHCDLVMN